MNGRIAIESTEKVGTDVRVYLLATGQEGDYGVRHE